MGLKLKHMLVIWACVYLLATGLMLLANGLYPDLPLQVRTLVLTGVVVPTMMFLIVLAVNKCWVK